MFQLDGNFLWKLHIVMQKFNIELLFQLRELFIKYSILLDWSNINI